VPDRSRDDAGLPDPIFRSTSPRPLGGLGDLAELLGGDTDRSRRFLGGIAVGAMVGAAIAGAALMRRRRGTGDPPRS
jgi:hypothetical protein